MTVGGEASEEAGASLGIWSLSVLSGTYIVDLVLPKDGNRED